jgi:hypothetical protein
MDLLACYLLAFASLCEPRIPTKCVWGDVIRDDRDGITITGPVWDRVGKVLPGGRFIHVMWTQKNGSRDGSCAYPGLYSWDAETWTWRGYYGRSECPYTNTDILRER